VAAPDRPAIAIIEAAQCRTNTCLPDVGVVCDRRGRLLKSGIAHWDWSKLPGCKSGDHNASSCRPALTRYDGSKSKNPHIRRCIIRTRHGIMHPASGIAKRWARRYPCSASALTRVQGLEIVQLDRQINGGPASLFGLSAESGSQAGIAEYMETFQTKPKEWVLVVWELRALALASDARLTAYDESRMRRRRSAKAWAESCCFGLASLVLERVWVLAVWRGVVVDGKRFLSSLGIRGNWLEGLFRGAGMQTSGIFNH